MSETLDYLKKTYSEIPFGNGDTFSMIRPRMKCKDGFEMSVQGSSGHYCSPRIDGWRFTSVEIGYPSKKVKEFMPYAEDKKNPTDTIYGYVPVEIVDAVIAKHKGLQ